jgi:hypothetical protein
MAATASYQAGFESNATQISYANEVTWGVVPAVQFQAVRYTSETLGLNKTRSRPSEITGAREATQAVTTQQTASGAVNYALSYGTFDEWMACTLQADWQAPQSPDSILVDITMTTGTNVITSTLSTKFNNVSVGQWLRIFGAVNAGNNGYWYITAKASGQNITVEGPQTMVTETSSAGNIKIRACQLKNSNTFKSLFLEQMFSATQFLTYPGAYPTRWTLTGGLGSFPTGAFEFAAKSQTKAVTEQSTGAVLAAPTTRVFDPVAGWVAATWNGAAIASAIDRFAFTVENTGAAAEFAMGSSSAAGILGGLLTASGSFRTYYKDATQLDLSIAETAGRLAFIVKDPVGSAYIFTFLSAVLTGNPNVTGPGSAVMADWTVEGGPSGSGTFTVDKLPAT